VTTFVVLSVVAFLFELVGTFSGYTMLFSNTVNFVQFVLHSSGSVRLAWYIIFEGATPHRPAVGGCCQLGVTGVGSSRGGL
jgi:hypothetical protein